LAASFSPDSSLLATAGGHDCAVQLWDLTTGEEQAALKGHAGPVHSGSFRPNGKVLVSGSADGMVKLWDLTAVKGPAAHR
jgi:WD40 repeat protein